MGETSYAPRKCVGPLMSMFTPLEEYSPAPVVKKPEVVAEENLPADPTERLLYDIAKAEKKLDETLDGQQLVVDKYSLEAWSHSKLKVLKNCPYNFYLKYILKIKRDYVQRDDLLARIGTAAHSVLEHVMKGKSVSDSFTIAKRENEKETKLTEEQWEGNVMNLDRSISEFATRIEEFDRRHPIKRVFTEFKMGITKDYQPTSFFAKDVYFRGIIDLAFQVQGESDLKDLIIIDHKTGGGEFARSTKNYDSQLDAYKPLFHYGVENINGSQGGIHFIREGKMLWGNWSNRETIEKNHIGDLEWSIEGAVDKCNDIGYFKHVMGSYCQYCDYKSECKDKKLKDHEMTTKKYFNIKPV